MLDNEDVGQVSGGQPRRPLLVAFEAAAATADRVVLSTSVVVEGLLDAADDPDTGASL